MCEGGACGRKGGQAVVVVVVRELAAGHATQRGAERELMLLQLSDWGSGARSDRIRSGRDRTRQDRTGRSRHEARQDASQRRRGGHTKRRRTEGVRAP
jgi:hypothetical protein